MSLEPAYAGTSDIASYISIADENECIKLCYQNKDCVSATYYSNVKSCYIHDAVDITKGLYNKDAKIFNIISKKTFFELLYLIKNKSN